MTIGPSQRPRQDRAAKLVAIVGGGVIGLSIAWRVASAGYRVKIIDPETGAGASWVAGGMLAPIAEAWPGEESLLELSVASLAQWPDFADQLSRDSGQPSVLRPDGTLVVGVDSADRAELVTLAEYLASLGRTVVHRSGRELRRVEPSLGPAVRGGLEVPGDLAVDNRSTLAALRTAVAAKGAEWVSSRALGVRAGAVDIEESTVHCDVVVLAAGAYSGELHPSLRSGMRPVKGEIVRVRSRAATLAPPRHTIRGPVHGRQIYLVPRDSGELVLGATQYEHGFDTEVKVGGVRDLLSCAEKLIPGLAEYALLESAAGLRPGTVDNLPLVGWLEPGVLAATGHYRGGFLLAPMTSRAVVELLADRSPPPELAAADPARWKGHL